MIESRCGLTCSTCAFKEQMNCSGCINMDKPFWGEACPVKTCCEQHKFSHCGVCPAFPCALLEQFAYDPQQGDDGQRIAQCQAWAADDASLDQAAF